MEFGFRSSTLIASILLSPLLSATVARSDDFRCPTSGKIVKVGDTQQEVTSKCGRPTSRSVPSVTSTKVSPLKTVSTTSETWSYDFGSNYFVQNLTFEGNTLTRIEHGDHGSGSGSKLKINPPTSTEQETSDTGRSARGGRPRR